jgi:hypothetical protein
MVTARSKIPEINAWILCDMVKLLRFGFFQGSTSHRRSREASARQQEISPLFERRERVADAPFAWRSRSGDRAYRQ